LTRLVCDLQGVFDEHHNALILSDPSVHSYYSDQPDRKHIYGETDCGQDGHHNFFKTHYSCHGTLCDLVIRGYKKPWLHRQGNQEDDNCEEKFPSTIMSSNPF
jgi:Alpha-kinase family